MGRTALEKKYTERRLNFRTMIKSIMDQYEHAREEEIESGDDIFTESELTRLDTIYYKMQAAEQHLRETAEKHRRKKE
ncbi:MAG: hypothetical protein KAR20_15395 [Candidatus Heimdallarchaeota archaeon]|nr:hypothetical protein [Candidatus Heimdallarchaeota archaeon]